MTTSLFTAELINKAKKELASTHTMEFKECVPCTLSRAVLEAEPIIRMLEENLKACVKELEAAKKEMEMACITGGNGGLRIGIERLENFLMAHKQWGKGK